MVIRIGTWLQDRRNGEVYVVEDVLVQHIIGSNGNYWETTLFFAKNNWSASFVTAEIDKGEDGQFAVLRDWDGMS